MRSRWNLPVYIGYLVASMVAGPLFSAGFSEGQIVKQGQQIFQIDPRPFAEG